MATNQSNGSGVLIPRAPGQRGGPAWKGPRAILTARVDPLLASVVKQSARREGLTLSDFIAATLARSLDVKQ